MINGNRSWAARSALLLILSTLLGLTLALPATADSTFSVDSLKDTPDVNIGDDICADAKGKCTLRAAVQEANFDPDTDTVFLPAGLFTLTRAGADENDAATGDLDINAPLEIYGMSRSATVIDAGLLDRIFDVRSGSILTIEALTLRNGKTTGEGGCINVDGLGTLDVSDTLVTGCTAIAGGGIRVVDGANAVVMYTTFSGNKAKFSGGAIYAYAADSVTIMDSKFASNSAKVYGGAIHATTSGSLNVLYSTFTANKTTSKAGSDGGAILANGVFTAISYSTFRGNSSTYYGGAVEIVGASALIDESIFEANTAGDSGGGLYLYEVPSANIGYSAFVNNTVTGGTNVGGGIIVDGSTVEIVNSTISGNRAGTGAGIHLYNFPVLRLMGSGTRAAPALTLDFVTVAKNRATISGGGIGHETGTVTMTRTILSNNRAPSGPDCASTIALNDSLLGSNAGCNPVGNFFINPDPLGVLTYLFDGLTPVHVPSPASPAIGGVSDCSDVTIDQRLVDRPESFCDIGAVQVDVRDLLKNGNFEASLTDWTFSTTTGSKIAGKAAFTGSKGLMIKGGAGALTVLKQKLPVAGLLDGDWITFGGYLSIADNVPVNAVAQIVLKYSDGTTDKQSLALETNGGMYCGCTIFGEIPVDLTGGRTVTKLIVQLKDRTPARKYYIDYLYVTVDSEPIIIRNGANGLLPPPAAPDGFRGTN